MIFIIKKSVLAVCFLVFPFVLMSATNEVDKQDAFRVKSLQQLTLNSVAIAITEEIILETLRQTVFKSPDTLQRQELVKKVEAIIAECFPFSPKRLPKDWDFANAVCRCQIKPIKVLAATGAKYLNVFVPAKAQKVTGSFLFKQIYERPNQIDDFLEKKLQEGCWFNLIFNGKQVENCTTYLISVKELLENPSVYLILRIKKNS